MENLTNQVLELKKGKKYFVLRQAAYKGITYFFVAEVTPDGEDFTNKFTFLEKIDKDGKFIVKEVKNPEILQVLAKNIKLD
ncbi:MAG: hypothetical protein GX758_04505 [Tenericutes bacterium]|nr:hypothetical protein [Mycoplasmatota bacterium]